MADFSLQQNLSLSQTLSPQMQQSLHLLQAPLLELNSLIQQELVSNPVLDESEPEVKETTEEEDWEKELQELKQNEEDWRDYFSQNSPRINNSSEAQERHQFLLDSQVEQETLSDHLRSQLALSNVTPEIMRVGEEIIGNIDHDGFFKASLNEVALAAQVPIETASKALTTIQSFHPSGIAAADLKETLLIQLRQRGKQDSTEYEIIKYHLEELGRKRYQEIARKLKISLDRIKEAAQYIAQLQPRPGSPFSPEQPHQVVQAEAAFIPKDGTWSVQLNNEHLPRLRINDTYKDLLGSKTNEAGLRDYLKDRIRAGKFLIKCLHQRQDTIHGILTEIANQQSEFLDYGTNHLKPLTMNQVAEVVGVHETTVSRAIANKYVQTPWGVLPVKYFFTSGYQTADGKSMSNTSIKENVATLIANESPESPLSDSEIVKRLKKEGISLARRTVAKYRSELNILPSNLRKSI